MAENSNHGSIDGVFYKINKKIEKRITAKYHRIKDWVMDPKGYFLIGLDRKKNLLQVGYCKFEKLGNSPVNDMVAVVAAGIALVEGTVARPFRVFFDIIICASVQTAVWTKIRVCRCRLAHRVRDLHASRHSFRGRVTQIPALLLNLAILQ